MVTVQWEHTTLTIYWVPVTVNVMEKKMRNPKQIKDSPGRISVESHYAKQADGFVYYYWRVVGLKDWNVQKTAMKEVPTVEIRQRARKGDV